MMFFTTIIKSNKLALLIIFLFVIILTVPDFFLYPGADYGVYSYGAHIINKGGSLYKDFWDHKGPGIYGYLAMWQIIFGSNWWSIKASLIPIYFLWGVAIYFYSKLILKKPGAVLLLSLLSVYSVLRLGFDANRSGAILVLSVSVDILALYAIIRSFNSGISSKKRYFWGIVAGSLAFIAFLIRQTSLVAGLVSFIFCGYYFITKENKIELTILGLFSGFFLIGTAFIYFVLRSSLSFPILYDRLVFYNSNYSNAFVSFDSILLWKDIFLSDQVLWVLMLTGLICMQIQGFDFLKSREYRLMISASLIAIVLSLIAVKPISFYRIQYIPHLFVISFVILVYLWENTHLNIPFYKLVRIIILLFLGVYYTNIIVQDGLAIRNWYITASSYNFQISNYPDQVVSRSIKEIPGARSLFVLGNRPWIYMWSGLDNSTEYYYTNALFTRGYLTNGEFSTFLSEFQLKLPDVVVTWANYPPSKDELYDVNRAIEIDDVIKKKYKLYKTLPFTSQQVWPYEAFQVKVFIRN